MPDWSLSFGRHCILRSCSDLTDWGVAIVVELRSDDGRCSAGDWWGGRGLSDKKRDVSDF